MALGGIVTKQNKSSDGSWMILLVVCIMSFIALLTTTLQDSGPFVLNLGIALVVPAIVWAMLPNLAARDRATSFRGRLAAVLMPNQRTIARSILVICMIGIAAIAVAYLF